MFKRMTEGYSFTEGYTFRVISLVFLVLILLIPLGLITSIVEERSTTADYAEADIMSSWGGSLTAIGPVIALEAARTTDTATTVRTPDGKDEKRVVREVAPFNLVFTPKELHIAADFTTEVRKRGIFSVPLFYGTLTLKGSFDPAMALASLQPNEKFSGAAAIVISLRDLKGIRKIVSAKLGDQELFFQPGKINAIASYYGSTDIFASLGRVPNRETEFEIVMEVQGGRSVEFAPFGQNTHVEISSDWGSPSFQGAFLPASSTITSDSFSAQWDISYLSRDIPLVWRQSERENYTPPSIFGVDFYRAIDTYSLNTRAVKYAILILIVPFLTLFLLEIVTKTRIHPVPYLLCGIGNAVFYLLLLSLSEQISFYAAYLIAAFAVTLLLTLYSRSLLTSPRKSWFMGLVAAVAYTLLYAVLNAESYALLIGSVVTFAVSALIMFLTRKLDWYGTRGGNGGETT